MAGKKKIDGAKVTSDNWGGKREGAGRPHKGEQLRIKELMDDNIDPDFVVQKIFQLIDNGDYRAIDLYMKYRVGTPTQSIDLKTTGDIDFRLSNLISFGDDEKN